MQKFLHFGYPTEYRKNIASGNFFDGLRCGISQLKMMVFRKIEDFNR
jgi:hypothetical protein